MKRGICLLFNKRYYSSGGYSNYLKNFKKKGLVYAKKIIELLKPKKSWKFLDVGCGMGGLVLALRKLGFNAFGTEISDFCLENSPAKNWMIKASVLNLPFEKESFDFVSCIDVLLYLKEKDLQKAIKELAKITKKFLFLETITKFSPNSSQKINPDSLRQKILPTPAKLIKLAEKENLILIGNLFPFNLHVDFNYLFLKRKRENLKFLYQIWKRAELI